MQKWKKLWLLVFLITLLPAYLYIYRWVEWDFQPSWLSAAKFFSDIYIPLFTLLSVAAIAAQIWSKSRADQSTVLIDGFRRQCAEIKQLNPGSPGDLFKATINWLASGRAHEYIDVEQHVLQHSKFNHAILAIGYSLSRLREVDQISAEMLRMELFMTIERADFAKYEYICAAVIRPKGYQCVCCETFKLFPINNPMKDKDKANE